MASAAKQDYEWQQDFKTSLITVEFAVPRGTRADSVYVEASQRKLAAGVYGKEPNVCGTLLFPIDVQQVRLASLDRRLFCFIFFHLFFCFVATDELRTEGVGAEGESAQAARN